MNSQPSGNEKVPPAILTYGQRFLILMGQVYRLESSAASCLGIISLSLNSLMPKPGQSA